jgi:hypothetical protein
MHLDANGVCGVRGALPGVRARAGLCGIGISFHNDVD